MEQASCLLSSVSVLVQDLSTPEVELAYAIAKSYRNQGLTTEATEATLKYGFEIIGLDRIVPITRPTNFSSQRVMTKAGLKYEKDAHYYGLDVVYYAILQEEFTKRVITPDSETRRLLTQNSPTANLMV